MKFGMGIPIYYYMLGRKLFGDAIKYPLYRLARYPEWYLRDKLYLDFSGRAKPRFTVPDKVDVPEHRLRPAIPELEQDILPASKAAPFLKVLNPGVADTVSGD